MTANPCERQNARSVTELQLVDKACDKFEAEWIAANLSKADAPSIQEHLVQIEPALRRTLLEYILRLDVEYRRRADDTRKLEDYLSEFADYASVVNELFVDTSSTGGSESLHATREHDALSVEQDLNTEADSALGETIGRFRVLRELGRGSFGTVYLALDEGLERQVAIKVAHRATHQQSADDRELSEARMVASLDHSAIVPVLECGRRDNGSLYVVSKFIDGTDLKTRINEFGFLVHEAVALIASVAEALHYAHGKGLVHRDIKPANILIDTDHRPYLTDFGLALKDELAGTGEDFVGTPCYMSPEQARSEGHLVDSRSDVFSVAIVLYELIFGRLPFVGQTREKLLEAICRGEPPDLTTDNPLVTPELQRILRKALSRRRSDRYQTAKELADDLRAWLEDRRPAAAESAVETMPVVPRGLRCFTAEDAPFFTRLVPGPRTREGLPEAIDFWMTRIESRQFDEAFRVGVLYGHSGTGKSSLIKAGVLPYLDRSVVSAWVTATPDQTERTLLKTLQLQFPSIASDVKLPSAIRELRDHRLPSDQKLLVVVDQFEEWLSTHKDFNAAPLVAALSQCDGIRVQVLLLVRDEYWSETTHCLAAADVETNADNSRATELFDATHSRHVLEEFGKALQQFDEHDADNQRFVQKAVEQMTASSALVPVRLALFTEAMKSRPWTSAELRRLGGVEGATKLLLDQIVSGETAHPTLKQFHMETGFLLRALLPVNSSSLRATPATIAQLREASGLDEESITPVLDILDHEYRIVSAVSDVEDDQPRYGLSHDYLVPIIRQWSQRTHGDTFTGRMELLLDERAKVWATDHRARSLPGPLEWAAIAIATRGKPRTNAARQMMWCAARRYGLIAIAVAVSLATAGLLFHG